MGYLFPWQLSNKGFLLHWKDILSHEEVTGQKLKENLPNEKEMAKNLKLVLTLTQPIQNEKKK